MGQDEGVLAESAGGIDQRGRSRRIGLAGRTPQALVAIPTARAAVSQRARGEIHPQRRQGALHIL